MNILCDESFLKEQLMDKLTRHIKNGISQKKTITCIYWAYESGLRPGCHPCTASYVHHYVLYTLHVTELSA
jgi:hypothetical protein